GAGRVINQNVRAVGRASERDDVRMLEQQDLIRNGPLFAQFDKLLLQVVSFGIWRKPQISGFADLHHAFFASQSENIFLSSIFLSSILPSVAQTEKWKTEKWKTGKYGLMSNPN